MYAVRWSDHEGDPQQRQLDDLDQAWLEAADLARRYENVTITRPDGSCYEVR